MSTWKPHRHQELFAVLMTLFREIRCCSRDEALCRGVTFHQFVILDAAAGRQPLELAQLHGILGVEKSTTTRLVTPLLRRGLLARQRAVHDSRAATLALTKEGREVHAEVKACLGAFFRRVDRALPKAERDRVLEAMRVFALAIRQAADGGRCCRKPLAEVKP